MTANAFCSVSLDICLHSNEGEALAPRGAFLNAYRYKPPLVLVSVGNQSHMHALLAQGKRYGVSVLASNQEALSRNFSGRSQALLQIPFAYYEGYLLIKGSLARLTRTIVHAYPAGDHTLLLVRWKAWHIQLTMRRSCFMQERIEQISCRARSPRAEPAQDQAPSQIGSVSHQDRCNKIGGLGVITASRNWKKLNLSAGITRCGSV